MLDFQQKRKAKSLMYNRVTIVILFVVVLFALHSTWVVYKKQRESQTLREVSEKKVGELSVREKEIDDKIKALDTQQGIEKEIRSKFNVIKGDENMVIVLDDENASTSQVSTTTSFWQKVKSFLLFGKW